MPWPRIPGPGIPAIILVVGVNGTGKTTTIAKLAYRFRTLGARLWSQGRLMVPRANTVFAADGSLSDPKIRAALTTFLQGYVAFVESSPAAHG